jgi:very-short-patch-repair endonuclease
MSFEEIVARQAGVLAVRQAVGCGVSAATVHRRVREGRWRRLHPGVVLVGGHRLTGDARLWAAWLWAGERSCLSGPTAAFRHRMLDLAPAVVELTVPTSRRPRSGPGVAVRRRDLHPDEIVHDRGLRLVSAPLTVLETAVALPDGSAFLDRALQRHVRFPELYRAYCRGLGRWGSPAAGRLLVASADRAESAAERLLVRILRAAGVTGWVLGHPVGPYRIDLAFVVRRVAVEVDGWAWHVDAVRFRSDRRRQNVLVAQGWQVLRFTWHDLTQRPDGCVAEIRAALVRAA